MGAALMLVACGEGGSLFDPATEISVAGGSITVAGPSGYCIDRSATRASFVLLGSCASIGNNSQLPAPAVRAALTASVAKDNGSELAGDSRRLGQFFRSELGRTALARNGQPGSVRILSSQVRSGVFFVKVRDTSPGLISGLSPDYWRALLDVRGRIVTLSVNSFKENPLSNADGFTTLKDFVRSVQQANPALVDDALDPV